MGVYNEDIKENEAFFSFTKTFLKHGLNVPAILGTEKEKKIYLENYKTAWIETTWDNVIMTKLYYELNKKYPYVFF